MKTIAATLSSIDMAAGCHLNHQRYWNMCSPHLHIQKEKGRVKMVLPVRESSVISYVPPLLAIKATGNQENGETISLRTTVYILSAGIRRITASTFVQLSQNQIIPHIYIALVPIGPPPIHYQLFLRVFYSHPRSLNTRGWRPRYKS